jgi:SAM-dependent methyltransferase
MNYSEEAEWAGATYECYLRELLPVRRLLEIGCGSGFFLERAVACGCGEVRGVEPSRHAVEMAPAGVRDRIVCNVFRPGLFPPGSFDLVCAFQVFDHMAHPAAVLEACREVLAPGGRALFIQHDAGAWANRLLGERSPIIDVEHIFLYDRRTIARIFTQCGFEVERVFAVRNRYPLSYWAKLAPLPAAFKSVISNSVVGRIPLSWSSGNLGIVAQR